MTEQLTASTVLFDRAKAALAARSASGDEPEWLSRHRKAAADWLLREGFPSNRHEAWRFFPLKSTLSMPFSIDSSDLHALARPSGTELGGLPAAQRVSVINGRAELGPASQRGPWRILRLSEAWTEPRWAACIAAQLSDGASLPDGFAALNAALFNDAVVAVLPAGSTGGEPLEIEIVTESGRGAAASTPRVFVLVEPRAEARLVERHTTVGSGADCLSASVFNIAVQDDAELVHVRLLLGSAVLHSLDVVGVRQARGSRYRSKVVTLGGKLSRLDLRVALEGTGAECYLDGLYLAEGTEVVDHHTFVDHLQPHCTSLEHYRGVVSGRAHSVFDGTLKVRAGAQRTSARQENRNLLLSGNAVIHTKPHLEIDADDVTCSHGATVGQLDADELFYLRARGIGDELGRALLIHAFVVEILDRVVPPWVGPEMRRAVLERLPGGQLVEAVG